MTRSTSLKQSVDSGWVLQMFSKPVGPLTLSHKVSIDVCSLFCRHKQKVGVSKTVLKMGSVGVKLLPYLLEPVFT